MPKASNQSNRLHVIKKTKCVSFFVNNPVHAEGIIRVLTLYLEHFKGQS